MFRGNIAFMKKKEEETNYSSTPKMVAALLRNIGLFLRDRTALCPEGRVLRLFL
jgi:hypothetical protein